MKHVRGIASGLVIAIALMMAGSTAISQLNIRVNTNPRPRHVVVHHPREHVRVRVRAQERHPAIERQYDRHDDRHDNQRGTERR
jgi:hypothetical protein